MHRDPQLAVDHAILERQHRELAAAAELVYHAQRSRDKSLLLQRLDALCEMSVAHFALEERLMVQTGYEVAAVHSEQHREIIDQIRRFRGQLRAGRFALQAGKVAGFLREWIAGHALRFDRDLADHLSARL